MTVFFSYGLGIIAVNESKIFSVSWYNSSIQINFDNGEMEECADGNWVKKTSVAFLKYEKPEQARIAFENYYKALSNGHKIFDFTEEFDLSWYDLSF